MSTAIERTFFEQAPGFSPSENPFQRNPPKGVPGTFGSDGSCWSVTDLVLEKDKKEAHIYLSYAKGIPSDTQDSYLDADTGERHSIYDYRKARKWQHLPVLGYSTWLHCRLPSPKDSFGE